MVKFFFFVIINRFSIDEDFSFAKGFDGDLVRTFIFNFTVLLQDAKQMETTKTDMEIAKKLGNYIMRNTYRNSMSITSSPPEKEGTKDVEDFSSLGIWTPPYCNF